MHICFKIIIFYYTLRCSTCFGHYCFHHQEPSTTAHAASGYRVVLRWLVPPALFCCYAVTTEQGWRNKQQIPVMRNSENERFNKKKRVTYVVLRRTAIGLESKI
jgi:hypothetical protein